MTAIVAKAAAFPEAHARSVRLKATGMATAMSIVAINETTILIPKTMWNAVKVGEEEIGMKVVNARTVRRNLQVMVQEASRAGRPQFSYSNERF